MTTTTIVKLTDAQKFALRNPLNTRSVLLAGAEAIRIIDQLTTALEAAEQEKTELDDMVQVGATDILRERTRAEALQARVAELEALREATLAPEGHGGYLDLVKRANAAESELADLRALSANDLRAELEDLRGRVERAEHELAKSIHPAARRALEVLRGR